MITVGTGIGGGLILGGEVYRGATGAAAELGHMVIQIDGPPARATARATAASRRSPPGTALGREGHAAAERQPDSALGRLLAEGRTIDGKAVTEAGARRRRGSRSASSR